MSDRRLRVLFVAFYFPPTSGGGIERTLRFLGDLPQHGIDAEALVPTDAKWLAEDPASLARIPEGLTVHRVPYRGPSLRVLPADRLRRARPGLPRLALRARLAPQRLLVPDVNVPWLGSVVPAALKLLRSGRFDALVTTAPPHSVTVAGAIIARRSGVPWIADWRDPWLTHPDLDLRRREVRAKLAAIAPVARRAAAAMDAVVCVPGADEDVRALRPDLDVAVIPNGVDVEELAGLPDDPLEPGAFTFAFAGYFFGDRSPRVFLEALADVRVRRPDLAPRLRARFLGSFPDADRARLDALGLADVVTVEGTRPREDVLRVQRRADCLLLFMQDAGGRGRTFTPAKTWEYLAAARPVLALVPPDGEAARVLQAHGDAAIVAPSDRDGAARAIERVVERALAGDRGGRVLPADVAASISRGGRAEAFAQVIRGAVERHPPTA